MLKYKLAATCIILILAISVSAHAGLKQLMELGRNQAAIAKALNKETKSYIKVKKAILSEKLKEGMSAKDIRKKYGEPVIDIYDEKRNVDKWLYMPAASTHFEGEKLYLFMDAENKLVGWKLENQN